MSCCIVSHCSAVVERDAAASRVIELESEIKSLKNELSQVQNQYNNQYSCSFPFMYTVVQMLISSLIQEPTNEDALTIRTLFDSLICIHILTPEKSVHLTNQDTYQTKVPRIESLYSKILLVLIKWFIT